MKVLSSVDFDDQQYQLISDEKMKALHQEHHGKKDQFH